MKKKRLFIALIFLSIFCTYMNGESILMKQERPTIKPRSLTHIPFNADMADGVLTLTAYASLSNVRIEIENTANESILSDSNLNLEESSETTYDLSTLVSGTYTLYIYIGDTVYYGTFELNYNDFVDNPSV